MTEKLAITKLSSLDIVAPDTSTNLGFYIPKMTTTERDRIPAYLLREGIQIFNTTLSRYQGYLGTAWTNISLNITTATGAGLVVGNSPLSFPSGASADVEVAANQVAGFVYYNTTLNTVRGYFDGAWVDMYLNATTATGVGLVAGNSPFSLPSGTSAAVELAGNQVAGFVYYNTTLGHVRGYLDGAWTHLYMNVTTATGVGLVIGNSPFSLPSGTSAAVELAGNQVDGFVYYNTTLGHVKAYLNGAWTHLYMNVTAATGVGLVAGNSPFSLPSGTRAAVEVAGNQVNGFTYYDTTNDVLRSRVGGAWLTITAA